MLHICNQDSLLSKYKELPELVLYYLHSFPHCLTPIITIRLVKKFRSLIKVEGEMKSENLIKAFGIFKPVKNETFLKKCFRHYFTN